MNRISRLSLSLALCATMTPAMAWCQRADAGVTRDAGLSPAEVARRAQVIARVGRSTITVGEFEDALNEAPAPVRQTYLDPARRREHLQRLVTTMLLADEARRRGLERNPEVASAVRRILSQRAEESAILQAVTAESITDAEVAAYYQQHIGDYQQPEFRRATILVVADRATAAQVLPQVRTAHNDLRRVRELVRQHSVDAPSRDHDGDAFYFQRTGAPSGDGHAVDPALAAAVFSLARETDITPQPVALADGRFGLAMLTGIRPALQRNLNDPGVAASIRGFILRDRRTQREAELLQAVRDRLHPEVHEERLDLIHLPPSDLGSLPPVDPESPLHPRH